MKRQATLIGHLDADCFYCSAERVRFDDLRELPVAVLGNQGACVIARSYEMRKFNVGVGIPIWEAVVKCPDGVYLKRDFRWYEVLSRAMLTIVQDLSTEAEYYSIDEFFFDATPPRGMTPQDYAVRIRDRIMESVGVPVTVGIARSKTLAKLISDSAKPFGAKAVLDVVAERELLASQPVTEISGIAGRRAQRLLPHGIVTCLDFARADRGLVRELLTSSGEALWWELNGEPSHPILTQRPVRKAISRGGSFGGATSNPHVIWAWLVRNVERMVEELAYYGFLAGRVEVWIGYKGGKHGAGAASLTTPTNLFDDLLGTFSPCLRRAYIPNAVASRMHIFCRDLRRVSDRQAGLFEVRDQRAEILATVKREINKKLGRFTIRSAATLLLSGLYADDTYSFDICDIRDKLCF